MKDIPATEIKIDRTFISTMTTNVSDWAMVNSTIILAHSLDRVIVAEGVEDISTLTALKELDCDYIQGYLIARPLPLSELLDQLRPTRKRATA
jgi:diguanylate cyclase